MLKKVIFVAQGKEAGNSSKSLGDIGRLRVRRLTSFLTPHINGSKVMIEAADERLCRETSRVIASEIGMPKLSYHRALNFPGSIEWEILKEQFFELMNEREVQCEVLIACSPHELVDKFLTIYAKSRNLVVDLQGQVTTSSARILDLETGRVDTVSS